MLKLTMLIKLKDKFLKCPLNMYSRKKSENKRQTCTKKSQNSTISRIEPYFSESLLSFEFFNR